MAASVDGVFAPQGLAGLYADMNRALLDAEHGPDTVAAVARIAVTAGPGVEQASVSEGREGRFRTRASTGDIALSGDLIQYQLGRGPCVDAMIADVAVPHR